MPFLPILIEGQSIEPKNADKNNNIPQPHQVPIFLIGGIGGLGTDWASVIEQLRLTGDNRPIYAYYDPRNVPDPKHPNIRDELSISDQVSFIVESMQEHLPPGGPAPYLIAGYSYGCGLAAEAAIKLHRDGAETDLFLVDGATFEVAKKYFSTSSINLVNDLVSIVTSIAKMAIGEEVDITISESELNKLTRLNTIACIDKIEQILRAKLASIHQNDQFSRLLSIAKYSINSLLKYEPTPGVPDGVVDRIVLLTTTETVEKHTPPDKYLGWNKYTENLSVVVAEELRKQAHTDLLSIGCAEKLASLIKKFAFQETNPDKLYDKLLDLGQKAYAKIKLLPSKGTSGSKDASPLSSPRTSRQDRSSEGCPELSVESFSDDDTGSDEEKRLDSDQIVKKLQKRIERIEETKRSMAAEKRPLRDSGHLTVFGVKQPKADKLTHQDPKNPKPTSTIATITVRA